MYRSRAVHASGQRQSIHVRSSIYDDPSQDSCGRLALERALAAALPAKPRAGTLAAVTCSAACGAPIAPISTASLAVSIAAAIKSRAIDRRAAGSRATGSLAVGGCFVGGCTVGGCTDVAGAAATPELHCIDEIASTDTEADSCGGARR